MYEITSKPLVRRTFATLRSAEFGFFGVVVYTRVHTPRRCGPPCSAGDLDFVGSVSRPWRTSWLMVGIGNLFPFEVTSFRTNRSASKRGPECRERGVLRWAGPAKSAAESAEKPSIIFGHTLCRNTAGLQSFDVLAHPLSPAAARPAGGRSGHQRRPRLARLPPPVLRRLGRRLLRPPGML